MKNTFNWAEVHQKLLEIEAPLSVAEYHGHLIGRQVGGHMVTGFTGIQIIAELTAAPAARLAEEAEYWQLHMQQLVDNLEMDNYGFYLLLPDDEISMDERLFSLSNWCAGFLNGIGCALDAAATKTLLKDDDTLSTLAEITNLDLNASDTEENEALYLEVVEYVRLAVLNLHEELKEKLGIERSHAEPLH